MLGIKALIKLLLAIRKIIRFKIAKGKVRFDSNNYKTICLYNGNQKIQEYTTANKRYSNQEDAMSAFWVIDQMGLKVTCIAVDGKKFTRYKGRLIRVLG